ncbi:MAG: M48 family metallopeptidase [Candidatus Ancillula sp.]|jgi:heat shock protein HtpX|nr:M48 family metallopeptidase [Candidatus Ancillula sp.]
MYLPIAQNKRNTVIAMALFLLIFLVFGSFLGVLFGYRGSLPRGILIDWGAFFSVLLVVLGMAGLYLLYMYRSADMTMLRQSGAREISSSTDSKLYSMVQNLAITSGIPMPRVYLINDSAPNAFATGRDPDHSSIAITTGLIDIMEDVELEAVIGHELSHIKNYDIRVSTIVFGMTALMGIVVSIAFRAYLFAPRSRSNNNSNSQNTGVLFLVIMVIALIMKGFMGLLSLVISRQREYLADASSAELMHNSDALANALEKLRDNSVEVKKYNVAGAHLFFADPDTGDTPKKVGKGGIASKIHNLFNTHPPLETRIARLRGFGDVKQGFLASR